MPTQFGSYYSITGVALCRCIGQCPPGLHSVVNGHTGPRTFSEYLLLMLQDVTHFSFTGNFVSSKENVLCFKRTNEVQKVVTKINIINNKIQYNHIQINERCCVYLKQSRLSLSNNYNILIIYNNRNLMITQLFSQKQELPDKRF